MPLTESKAFNARKILVIIFIAVFRGFNNYYFILPNGFAPGGITGISSIIQNTVGFPAQYTLVILNIPLLILSYIYIRKSFAFNTALNIVVMAAAMEVFSRLQMPQYSGDGADLLLAAIIGGGISGICAGIGFTYSTSGGGSDIVGIFIQRKYSASNVSWIIFALDSVVVLASGLFLHSVEAVMYSFVMLFVGSKAVEIVATGFYSAVLFEIVTEKPEELSEAIIKELHRGVTSTGCIGMYTHNQKTLLKCVVHKSQVSTCHRLIKRIDPLSFTYATSVREVLGQGFSHNSDING